jgi:ornithine carbamoyltransferase
MSVVETRPANLLSIGDLSGADLGDLLDLAERMKASPHGWVDSLRGETAVCLFEKPSTRTRVSFAAAAQRLGMLPLMVGGAELQLGRGEPIADTARVLSGYAAAIVVRTYAQERLVDMAAAASVPVINALSDQHHPCQALADLLTLRERFGGLRGLKLAYVGDGNNVAASLLEAGALAGMTVTVASPAGYWPESHVLLGAEAAADLHGGAVAVVDDPVEAVRGANAVYTDVWTSMGEDEQRHAREIAFAKYTVDAGLMEHAEPSAIFLHCLPAHRGEEVTAEVIDGPASAVWEQAANRMPTEQAVLYALIKGSWR